MTAIDGDDVSDRFEAFIHAPFKDDCAAERNDTSLALQITLTDDDGRDGHVLLLGDLAYETIKKIFEYSEHAGRPERLAWEVLLAPHHCSKKVMYVTEDGKEVLKQDILDLLEAHASESAVVVVSSAEFPASNKAGDNPPHLLARARYEEIAAEVICTGEYPDPDAPRPLVFVIGDDGFAVADLTERRHRSRVGKSAMAGAAAAGVGILAALAATAIARRRAGQERDAAAGARPGPPGRHHGQGRRRGTPAGGRLRHDVTAHAMSEGQRLALDQLRELVAVSGGAIDMPVEPTAADGDGWLRVWISLDCAETPPCPGRVAIAQPGTLRRAHPGRLSRSTCPWSWCRIAAGPAPRTSSGVSSCACTRLHPSNGCRPTACSA